MTPAASFPSPAIESPRDYGAQNPLVLPGYSWEHYRSLADLFQGTSVRVRFLDHRIEIMPPISETHEERKVHIGRLVDAWCLDRDIECFGRGSATMEIPDTAGGEPDESYYFGEKKGRPDLVIEIALTSGGLSKRAFYAKFQVPELWIWRKNRLEVHVFDEGSNQWAETRESRVLPGIPIDAIEACATLPSITQAVREFRKRCGAGE